MKYEELVIDQIQIDQENIRRKLSGIEELAASFKAVGQIQPVVVKRVGEQHYQLIAGHRRLAAAKIAGLKTLSAIVLTVEEERARTIQLVENIQRENLAAIEVAESLHALMQREPDTHKLGQAIGKSDKWVKRHVALLKVDTALIHAMQKHRLSFAQAEEVVRLSRVSSVSEAIHAAEQIREGALSKRDVRERAQVTEPTWRKTFSLNGKGYALKVHVTRGLLQQGDLEQRLENKMKEIEQLLKSAHAGCPPAEAC